VGQLFVDVRITMLAARTAPRPRGRHLFGIQNDSGGLKDRLQCALATKGGPRIRRRSASGGRRMFARKCGPGGCADWTRRHGLGDARRRQICRIGEPAPATPHTWQTGFHHDDL